MSAPRARVVLVGLVLAILATLGGCVNVPTIGPIDKVEGAQTSCQNCVNVEVAPPTAGDDPRQIVEGYLRATSNYQPSYSVARQFLTPAAAEKWSPEEGASIYLGSPTVQGNKVTLDGKLVGSLEPDHSYTARDRPLLVDFDVVKVGDEWRINKPPPGLMVAAYSFTSFYQAYELYFVGNNTALVPDPIYLPKFGSPANVTSALMKALLNGPTTWLKPAVTTNLPPGTTLSVDSVTITEGIADVPLSDSVLTLSDAQRSLMAAQVVYTLKQVVGVKGVLFTVNQQPFRVPESDPTSLAVSIEAISPEHDPIPFVAAEQLYAVHGRVVEQVSADADASTVRRIPGKLGDGAYAVASLAVSVTNTDLAVVTDNQTALRSAPTSQASDPKPLIRGATDLLRPQFTRYNEIWDVGRQGGRQQLWRYLDHRVTVDASDVLDGGEVVAFKISPDGSRLAAIRRTGQGFELGVARISRLDVDKVVVDGWRVLDTTQTNKPRITRMKDVSWLDATNLLVLGSATKDASLSPVQVSQDASEISADSPADNWDAIELTVLLRTQTALIVGSDGQTYKDDGNRWQPFLSGIKTIAYPG